MGSRRCTIALKRHSERADQQRTKNNTATEVFHKCGATAHNVASAKCLHLPDTSGGTGEDTRRTGTQSKTGRLSLQRIANAAGLVSRNGADSRQRRLESRAPQCIPFATAHLLVNIGKAAACGDCVETETKLFQTLDSSRVGIFGPRIGGYCCGFDGIEALLRAVCFCSGSLNVLGKRFEERFLFHERSSAVVACSSASLAFTPRMESILV
jgi:hypothetical protein